MRTIQDVQTELAIDFEQGLSESSVAMSRSKHGANQLTPLPREPLWKKFLEKFDEPIIKILLGAALLSMVVDLFTANNTLGLIGLGFIVVLIGAVVTLKKGEWLPTILFACAFLFFFVGLASGHVLVEGMAVMIAVILATGVSFFSEFKSDREFEALNSRKDSLLSKVLREGGIHSVPLEEVVVGDIVLLEMGDEIPADGRIIKANELMLDQSLMTGETEPVRKLVRPKDDQPDGPDQPGCVYRGTQVVDGMGQMVAIDVGDASQIGQIARRLSDHHDDEGEGAEENRIKNKLTISKELTPLQVKLSHLADLISKVGYIAAVLIFLAQLFRGIMVGDIFLPNNWEGAIKVFSELLSYFVTMVIIIVVAVPEGLPMSVTVSLALAMRKMTRANSLVRQLVACETIGSATVICSDKTGTLTQNKMQVDRVSFDGKVFERGKADWPKHDAAANGPSGSKPMDLFALISAVNSTANLEEKEGRVFTLGNSTEGSLLQWLRESGLNYVPVRQHFDTLYQLHFSSDRKRMTTVTRYGSKLVVLVKGASEIVLEHCQRMLTSDGQAVPISPETRAKILQNIQDAAALAMRTLAFAYAPLPEGTPAEEDALHAIRDQLEKELIFVGFVAIRDPLRLDVKDAVSECRKAGIGVKMVTGDNVTTARAIAYEIGLVDRPDVPINEPGAAVMTSDRFNELSNDDLRRELPKLAVLARARPLDKYRMVTLLQELGEVVAVTGDGTNDAPALKKADVGLAMGIAGTEVAKEASKIVLLDDSFSTIVRAVQWGRSLYENIQRFIQFQLTINVSALAITFLGVLLFNVKAPFTVLQLLWINVIMDTLASIALCSEPPRPDVMLSPPKRRDENILTDLMKRTILSTGAFFVVVMLGLLVGMKKLGWFAGDMPTVGDFTVRQGTLFFSIYVFFQVWNQINCRSLSLHKSGLTGLFDNRVFLGIAAIVAVGQILIVTIGGRVFQVEPLGLLDWLVVIACTASVVIYAEVMRRVFASRG